MKQQMIQSKGLDPEEVEQCQEELEELKEKYGEDIYGVAVMFEKD